MLYYNFNSTLAEPFNVIHPLQLNKVRKLLEHSIPKSVDYIFLFDGSLEKACNNSSDLDLYVISEDETYSLLFFS